MWQNEISPCQKHLRLVNPQSQDWKIVEFIYAFYIGWHFRQKALMSDEELWSRCVIRKCSLFSCLEDSPKCLMFFYAMSYRICTFLNSVLGGFQCLQLLQREGLLLENLFSSVSSRCSSQPPLNYTQSYILIHEVLFLSAVGVNYLLSSYKLLPT